MEAYDKREEWLCAYTAGVFDGEGSFNIRPDHRTYQISISQSDRNNGEAFVRWLRQQWGCGTVYTYTRTTNVGVCSTMWVWSVAARRDVMWLLRSCLPFLRIRCKDAEQAIKLIEQGIDGKQRWLRWSQKEDEFLRENFSKMSHGELAEVLRRTKRAVRARAKTLDITRLGGRGWRRYEDGWTSSEDRYLTENYGEKRAEDIASYLGRSVGAVYGRVMFLGIQKGRGWHPRRYTPTEDDYLRKHYATRPVREIAQALGRSYSSVKNRAKVLGVSAGRSGPRCLGRLSSGCRGAEAEGDSGHTAMADDNCDHTSCG